MPVSAFVQGGEGCADLGEAAAFGVRLRTMQLFASVCVLAMLTIFVDTAVRRGE